MTRGLIRPITLGEAAILLGLSPSTLRQQARKGTLDAMIVGKTYVTTSAAVERYRRDHLGRRGKGPEPFTKRLDVPSI